MLASLVISASLPRAFGDRGLVFAAADVALTIGRTLLVLAAIRRDHHLTKVVGRAVWWSTTATPCSKWALWKRVARSRLIAILALAAPIPVALVSQLRSE
jgi:low temperature requirement protein LtrA